MNLYGLVHLATVSTLLDREAVHGFDKPICNNKEVPLYLLRKLCVQVKLGIHVKNFDMGEFQEVVHGSPTNGKNASHNQTLVHHPIRGRPNSFS